MLPDEVNNSSTLLERRLVGALKRGDPQAFERMVRLHQNRVFSLCLRMMGNPQEAEDLAQEVFFTVFNSIRTFREESLLSTWIYRITRNHCLNRLKFLKRRAHDRKQSLDHTRQADLADGNVRVPRPDHLAEGKEMEAIVQEQINALTEEHRELIVLRDIERLSYEEIQSITGLPEGTVKSRLHRARMELALRMAPYLSDK
jgi:RNA polymerase sigma-70 factor (ECF subfamily)